MKVNKLKEKLQEIQDHRRAWGNLRHKLDEILIIGLLGELAVDDNHPISHEEVSDYFDWILTFPKT